MINNIFELDNRTNQVIINSPEALLIREFKALFEKNRNKCNEDPTGEQSLRAYRELTYIVLAIWWRSPYSDYDEQERHQESLKDANLTEEEFNDPTFRTACRKYKSLQESNRSIKMLKAAQEMCDKFIEYFTTVDPLTDRKEDGTPIYKVKDLQVEMQNIIKVHETLLQLEAQVKKEIESSSSLRGGFEDGFMPDDI